MASALPIIDFAPFLSMDSTSDQKLATAREIDKACREVGFFYLKNHGVPRELVQGMLTKAREFFETAGPEEKTALAIKKNEEGGDNARGYLKITSEAKGSHEVSSL